MNTEKFLGKSFKGIQQGNINDRDLASAVRISGFLADYTRVALLDPRKASKIITSIQKR